MAFWNTGIVQLLCSRHFPGSTLFFLKRGLCLRMTSTVFLSSLSLYIASKFLSSFPQPIYIIIYRHFLFCCKTPKPLLAGKATDLPWFLALNYYTLATPNHPRIIFQSLVMLFVTLFTMLSEFKAWVLKLNFTPRKYTSGAVRVHGLFVDFAWQFRVFNY